MLCPTSAFGSAVFMLSQNDFAFLSAVEGTNLLLQIVGSALDERLLTSRHGSLGW